MKMKLALLLGKLLYLLGKPFGKSTNLPGELALKICPQMMGNFRFDVKIDVYKRQAFGRCVGGNPRIAGVCFLLPDLGI